MTEQQIRELAERLRKHINRNGSFYGFERVISQYLRTQDMWQGKDVSHFSASPAERKKA